MEPGECPHTTKAVIASRFPSPRAVLIVGKGSLTKSPNPPQIPPHLILYNRASSGRWSGWFIHNLAKPLKAWILAGVAQ